YLKVDAEASLTIADPAGRTIRTLRNAPRTAGVNRIVWDLRYDPPSGAGGGRAGAARGTAAGGEAAAPAEEGRGGGRGGGGGPVALPGTYTVTLHAAGQDQKKT